MPDIEWLDDEPADEPTGGTGEPLAAPRRRRYRRMTARGVVAIGAMSVVAVLVAILVTNGEDPPSASASPSTSDSARTSVTVPVAEPELAFGEQRCGSVANPNQVDTVAVPVTVRRPVTLLSARLVRPVVNFVLVGARVRSGCGNGSIHRLPTLLAPPAGTQYLEMLVRVGRGCGIPAQAVEVRYRFEGSTAVISNVLNVFPVSFCTVPG